MDVEILIQMVEPYHGMSGSRSEKSRNEAIDWNELANPGRGEVAMEHGHSRLLTALVAPLSAPCDRRSISLTYCG